MEIMQTAAFARLGTRLWPAVFPACKDEGDVWSEQYLRCMARQYTCTTWHPCCTAPMGDGPHAVVDSRLRCGGVGGGTGLGCISTQPRGSEPTGKILKP